MAPFSITVAIHIDSICMCIVIRPVVAGIVVGIVVAIVVAIVVGLGVGNVVDVDLWLTRNPVMPTMARKTRKRRNPIWIRLNLKFRL